MNIEQAANETIVDYIDRVMNLKNEIEKTENSQIKEQDLAILLLQGLSQEYDYFVQVLTANDATELKLGKISTSLIQEEQRRSDKKPEVKNQESDIFYSKLNSKKKFVKGRITCYNCN
jgi:hypothetical protein